MLNPKNEKYSKEYLRENINILDGNEVYRVTDVLKCHCNPEIKEEPVFLSELLNKPEYEGTILREYIEKSKKPFDYKLMKEIIESHMYKIEPYDDNHVLVHIRSGDDLNNRGLGNKRNFAMFLSVILKKIPLDKIVVIVTTMHYGHAEYESIYNVSGWTYSEESRNKNIDYLYKLIEKIPHEVKIQSSIDTDTDFMHLILSKNMYSLKSTGGFSIVVKTLHDLFR